MRISDWSSDVCSSDLDVRPAVAANLGLVAHAAQRMADELPSRRAGDRAAKRCLAHARRTDEAKYRPLQLVGARLHGQIFDYPVLHLLKPVVIIVPDRLGSADNLLHFGFFTHGQAAPGCR